MYHKNVFYHGPFLAVCFQIHLHGNNMTTLHAFLHQDMLPAELGGSGPPYHMQTWAKELIGDEIFSFGENHIYWPDHSSGIK